MQLISGHKSRIFCIAFCLLNSLALLAQTDKQIQNRLLVKERNAFIGGQYEEAIEMFRSIQSLSLEYPKEATQIAINAYNELINSTNDLETKEQLAFERQSLKSILHFQNQLEEKEAKQAAGTILKSTVKTNYNQHAVYTKGSRIMRNGEKIKYEQFKNLLYAFEDSKIELIAAEKNQRIGLYLFGGTVVSYIVALAIYDKNPNLSNGLLVTGLSLNIASFPFFNKGQNQFRKAIWHYNREVSLNPN